MNSAISSEFYAGYRQTNFDCEWLAYLGCPMLYDGRLCVNRTQEEVEYHRKFEYHSWLEI